MAYEDLCPSKILTRDAFLNGIRLVSVIGGSSNAQPHIVAMARHAGVEINQGDWMEHGYDLPLLVNMQPAGTLLSERFHRAGGVPRGAVGTARGRTPSRRRDDRQIGRAHV